MWRWKTNQEQVLQAFVFHFDSYVWNLGCCYMSDWLIPPYFLMTIWRYLLHSFTFSYTLFLAFLAVVSLACSRRRTSRLYSYIVEHNLRNVILILTVESRIVFLACLQYRVCMIPLNVSKIILYILIAE